MQIHPAIIDLLFHEGGATEAEFEKVADNWNEQIESLMVHNEIERVMVDGEIRFRWIKKSKAEGEFKHNKKRSDKRKVASEKEKQMTFELKSAINEYWRVKDE